MIISPSSYSPGELLRKIKSREKKKCIVKFCSNCGCGMQEIEGNKIQCCNCEMQEDKI